MESPPNQAAASDWQNAVGDQTSGEETSYLPRQVQGVRCFGGCTLMGRLQAWCVPEGELEVHERVPGVLDLCRSSGGSECEDLEARLLGAKGTRVVRLTDTGASTLSSVL